MHVGYCASCKRWFKIAFSSPGKVIGPVAGAALGGTKNLETALVCAGLGLLAGVITDAIINKIEAECPRCGTALRLIREVIAASA